MFEQQPKTGYDVLTQLYARYDSMIESGQYEPFVYPWGSFGAALLILYLLFDHRKSPRIARFRYLAWICNFAFSIYTILYCRARNPAAAFGVGLISAWSCLWTSVLFVFNDTQTDFARIERTEARLDTNGSLQRGDKEEDHTLSLIHI